MKILTKYVRIVSWYSDWTTTGRLRNRGSIPHSGYKHLYSQNYSDRSWGPHSLPFRPNWDPFPGAKVEGTWSSPFTSIYRPVEECVELIHTTSWCSRRQPDIIPLDPNLRQLNATKIFTPLWGLRSSQRCCWRCLRNYSPKVTSSHPERPVSSFNSQFP